jgi:hypothetical protein
MIIIIEPFLTNIFYSFWYFSFQTKWAIHRPTVLATATIRNGQMFSRKNIFSTTIEKRQTPNNERRTPKDNRRTMIGNHRQLMTDNHRQLTRDNQLQLTRDKRRPPKDKRRIMIDNQRQLTKDIKRRAMINNQHQLTKDKLQTMIDNKRQNTIHKRRNTMLKHRSTSHKRQSTNDNRNIKCRQMSTNTKRRPRKTISTTTQKSLQLMTAAPTIAGIPINFLILIFS